MGSMSAVSWSPLLSSRVQSPSASLGLLGGFRRSTKTSLTINNNSRKSSLLHCSFLPSSSSLSFHSSLSGLWLGSEVKSKSGFGSGKRRGFMVVAAGRAALCLTKRNRSRKSLARTHGFRRRMRTTSGRAVIKRRRAKGRKILCTKSYPRSGKGS